MSLGLGLGIAGAIVGSAIGIGPQAGFLIGSFLGNLLDPPKIEGPRITDLKLQASEYGRPIPIIYGTMRIAGNIIWQTDLEEHKEKHGGKGGPEVTNYTYTASFAVMLCEGDVDHLEKVYADGRLVWDGEDTDDFRFTLYLGTESQLPDPTMEAVLGVGEVPAHRGYCYVVFEDLLLTDFGNRIPQLEFVVATEELDPIPIERIAENYDMPVTISQPAITSWPWRGAVRASNVADGDRVVSVIPNNGESYNKDLTYNSAITVGGGDWRPMDLILCNPSPLNRGDEYNLCAVGYYRPDSGGEERIPLWARITYSSNDYAGPFGIASGTGTVDWPMLCSDDVVARVIGGNSNIDVPNGIEYATLYGLPAGEFIHGSALSQDEKRLYLFTGASFSGSIDKWYEIIDSVVARQGGVSPTIPRYFLGFGNSAMIFGGGGAAGMFENNGQFMWRYATNDGLGGTVFIYEIDGSNNFAYNSFYSSATVDGPGGGSFKGSLQVLKTGYAGIIRDDGRLAIFRRLQPSSGIPLSAIIADLSSRTPLDVTEYDTSDLTQLVPGGWVPNQMEVRNAINSFRPAYFFDGRETDGVVEFLNRGGASLVTVPDADLGSRPGGDEAPGLLRTVRTQEAELPRRVYVEYIDAEMDYQHNTQYDERQVTHSQSETTVSLPIQLTARDAKIIAGGHVWGSYKERERLTWWLPRPYLIYDPADVMVVQGQTVRVERITALTSGVLEFDGVASGAPIYTGGASVVGGGSSSPPQDPPLPKAPTRLVLLDIHVISQHDSPFGFYAAMCPDGAGPWPGAGLYKSSDAGLTWVLVASTTTRDTIGDCVGALANYAGALTSIDAVSTVDVVLSDADATLSSATAAAFANGANLCAIRSGATWEILQFRDATLIATNTYTLTNFYRGKINTSAAIPGHAAGDTFVLFPCVNVDAPESDLNVALQYKAVTFGTAIADAAAVSFTNTGDGADEFYDTEADYIPVRRNLQTGTSYTLLITDRAYLVSFSNAGAMTCTLPATGLPVNWWCYIENRGVGTLTLDPAGASLLDNSATSVVLTANQGLFLQFDGTNYWTMRGGGGLISPLTTKGDVWGFATVDARIPIGTNTQVLMADSAQTLGLKWASLPVTTKGDLFTFDTAFQRLAVGSNTQVLTADSSTATGLKWATPFISPLTTKGDLHGFTTVDARVPVGSNGQVLIADSAQSTGVAWSPNNAVGGQALFAVATASGSPATLTVSSIPSTARSLLLILNGRDTASGSAALAARLQLNGDTNTANYTTEEYMNGTGAGVSASNEAATTAGVPMANIPGTSGNANACGAAVIYIPAYAQTTFHKSPIGSTFMNYSATPTVQTTTRGFTYKSTSAITQVTLTAGGTAFVDGTTLEVYLLG